MSGGFKSTPEDLETHSATVRELGDRLSKAAEAGRSVELGGETYGVIGQAFAGDAKTQIVETAEPISEVATGLRDFADGIASAGENYRTAEEGIRDFLKQFGGGG